jgi:rhamnosyltransferase
MKASRTARFRATPEPIAMSDSVSAVIVTYHPNLEQLAALFEVLSAQVTQMIVVDNGSKPDVLAWLLERAHAREITLLTLGDNFGIAAAQNRGIKLAVQVGARYVLLLDQDSMPCEGMVDELCKAAASPTPSGRRIAAVGPVHVAAADLASDSLFVTFDGFWPRKQACTADTDRIPSDLLTSSGMLIPTEAFDIVGLMDEELFIDHVETDWCFRARAKNLDLFGVCRARLIHRIGVRTARIWLGNWKHVPVHVPLRHYYLTRNSLIVGRRSWVPRAWRRYMAYVVSVLLLRNVVIHPRLRRMRMIGRGLVDGLAGRLGPF